MDSQFKVKRGGRRRDSQKRERRLIYTTQATGGGACTSRQLATPQLCRVGDAASTAHEVVRLTCHAARPIAATELPARNMHFSYFSSIADILGITEMCACVHVYLHMCAHARAWGFGGRLAQ